MIAASFNTLFPEHEASKATAKPKDFIAMIPTSEQRNELGRRLRFDDDLRGLGSAMPGDSGDG
jgi:hypothetical protein